MKSNFGFQLKFNPEQVNNLEQFYLNTYLEMMQQKKQKQLQIAENIQFQVYVQSETAFLISTQVGSMENIIKKLGFARLDDDPSIKKNLSLKNFQLAIGFNQLQTTLKIRIVMVKASLNKSEQMHKISNYYLAHFYEYEGSEENLFQNKVINEQLDNYKNKKEPQQYPQQQRDIKIQNQDNQEKGKDNPKNIFAEDKNDLASKKNEFQDDQFIFIEESSTLKPQGEDDFISISPKKKIKVDHKEQKQERFKKNVMEELLYIKQLLKQSEIQNKQINEESSSFKQFIQSLENERIYSEMAQHSYSINKIKDQQKQIQEFKKQIEQNDQNSKNENAQTSMN